MSIAYYAYTNPNIGKGGDAWGYWLSARNMNTAEFLSIASNIFNEQGTKFINGVDYIPAKLLGMNFFTNTLFFGLLGFIGFILLYRICIDYIPHNSKFHGYWLFPFILFLPSLHFWTSGVGKDTFLFLNIMMFAYGTLNPGKRFLMIIIALLLSYCIRPHIALILGISFGLAYILNGKIPKVQSIFFAFILITVSLLILPNVLEFTKIEDASLDSFENFSENKAIGLSYGKSFVNISSYPYPLKVLTFLYRPFFFDINGIPALIASFENLLLVLLSIQVIRSHFIQTFKAAPLVIQGLFLFSMLGVLAFSMSMSNLGIILRMRNMFLPGMIIFILWSFSYRKNDALS
jgi:hypothetical protein